MIICGICERPIFLLQGEHRVIHDTCEPRKVKRQSSWHRVNWGAIKRDARDFVEGDRRVQRRHGSSSKSQANKAIRKKKRLAWE